LENWLGSICWEGKSTFRKLHKRSNWFIGVFELENPEKIDFNEKDIRFQAVRSQGSGGQNVNKVNTAVRATHFPTGESVFVQDSRSQLENKRLSVIRLKEGHVSIYPEPGKEDERNVESSSAGRARKPVRTFSGTDFKKNYVDKSFKKQRNDLKNELKNYQNDLN
jgi:peptide chain release factor